MSFEITIQTMIFNILKSDSSIYLMVDGVYDYVPADKPFPYITIGESTHNEFDTVNTLGDDASISVHVWTRGKSYKGHKKTKEIQGAVYDAIHRKDVTLEGYRVNGIDWQNSTVFMDADGLTSHGVQNFRVLIERE